MYKTLKAPLVVQIEITGFCPNRCIHCYNYWRKEGEKSCFGNLSVSDADLIMEKLADAEVFHVVLTGGEPLLNKKAFFIVLEMAK